MREAPNKYESPDKKKVRHTYEFENERQRLEALEKIIEHARAASKLNIAFTIISLHTRGNRKGGDHDYDIYGYRITFEGLTEIDRFD